MDYIDSWEAGWEGGDKYICPAGIEDEFLRKVVRDAASEDDNCSFCGTAPAAPFDVLMEGFMVGVHNEYGQADDEGMPVEGGEYVFETYDHFHVADALGSDLAADDHAEAVLEEIRECMVDKAYASHWWLAVEPKTAYESAWTTFCEQIKHRTRFVFWAGAGQDENFHGAGEIPVAQVLDKVGDLLYEFGAIKNLPRGTLTVRARGHSSPLDSQAWKARDLGTNTAERSTNSTRMSPAGIPLFYGADDVETTLSEVARADDRPYFTTGQFKTTRDATIIDLTSVPPIPSVFDPERGSWRGQITFLHALVQELRQPVDTSRSNLDYVPTQVFTEYLLRVFGPRKSIRIRGLVWSSAAASSGNRCLAIDVKQGDCVDRDAGADHVQLELIDGSKAVHRRRTDEFRQIIP